MNNIAGLLLVDKKSVDTCVSSPPYYALRDYGLEPTVWPAMEYRLFGFVVKVKAMTCCLGLEPTPEDFIGHLVYTYRLVRETLKDEGTIWVNIGDSYAATGKKRNNEQAARKSNLKGSKDGQIACKDQQAKIFKDKGIKPKDMIGIPWMLAFALREDGWYLRQDIIWHKLNCMPESVVDRCTKNHEYIFLLSKKKRYYYDATAILQPIAAATEERLKQNIERQKGSARANGGGKINGNMKCLVTQNDMFIESRNVRPDDSRGGNQGMGGIPIVSKAHTFKRDNSKMSEAQHGQKYGTHRPDRKDTIPTGLANKRSVWNVSTFGFKEAHFATFPLKLIEPCIKAGSSEYGCCGKCGKPYRRLTKKTLVKTNKASINTKVDQRDIDADDMDAGSNRVKDGHKPGWVNETETLRWIATCKCGVPEIKPAVVMDMFMGRGTTAVVSSKLGRDWYGFEQSEKSHKISQRFLHQQLGIFNPIKHETI